MKYLLPILSALVLSSTSLAESNGPQPVPPGSSAIAGSTAYSGSHANAQSQSASVSGAVAQAGDATALSEGSMATAEGASADVGVSVRTDVPRQAPSVGLVVPQSDLMGCTKGFGLGGSRSTGSAVLGWSWLQRDCYAFRRFEMLAALGEKDAAAKAYCSRKMHWLDFGTQKKTAQPKCEAVIVQSLIDIETAREVAEVKKQIPTTSPIQKWLKLSNTKR